MKITKNNFGTISAPNLSPLFDALEIQHIDIDDFAKEAAINKDLLHDASYRIPAEKVLLIWENAVELTNDPYLGLKAGCLARPKAFGLLSSLVINSNTLKQAVEYIEKYSAVLADWGSCSLQVEGDLAYISYHGEHAHLPCARYAIEATLFSWINFLHWLLGDEIEIEEIRLSHSLQGDINEYVRAGGAPVLFDQASTCIVLNKKMLDIAIAPQVDSTFTQTLAAQAEHMIRKYSQKDSLLFQIRGALKELLPKGTQNIQDIATHIGSTPWIVRRRLNKQGMNFQQLVTQVRKELAAIYLQDGNISAQDVGSLLGFTNQSAFSRAFKSWYKKTPSEFRKKYAI